MPMPPRTDEKCRQAVEAYLSNSRVKSHAAKALGWDQKTFREVLADASRRGMLLDEKPAMPGFRITQVSGPPEGPPKSIQQKLEHGEIFEVPEGQIVKGVSALVDADGREIVKWIKTKEDAVAQQAAMEAAIAGFAAELPRAEQVNTHIVGNIDLVNQFTITDYHFGMLSWREETGVDYDLKIAERLWMEWFCAAVKQSPDAHTAILAQLGDLLHFDSLKAVTPASGHILDADSRFAKVVRVVIRCMRHAVRLLLEKHERVHLICADANHDEASEVWLREFFASHYEDEPRVTVDRSPGTYYAFSWGDVSLFYHHGHKRKSKELDQVFAARFRELYGNTKISYGHTGHLHSDWLFSSLLGIKVERHETLAAPSSYEANGGYHAGRSAKVITYHKKFGEVGRITLTPDMVKRDDAALDA